jgi:hypothetical protein
MMRAFAPEFFWNSLRDFRAWASVVGLVLAALNGATGQTFVLPTWAWLLVACAFALSMAIRSEWKSYKEKHSNIEPNMKLVDAVKRIVGTDDILGSGNHSKTADALLSIRENAHLRKLSVWARRDVLVAERMDLYPRTSVPADYWDEFDIDYLRFTDDQRGESKRVRGQPHRQRVENTTTTAIHVITAPDTIYRDFWFCAHEVGKIWPVPKKRIKLQWPMRRLK